MPQFLKSALPKNELSLATGALFISFSSVFVKTSQVPPTVSAFYRVFLGGLILIIACFFKGEFVRRPLKMNLHAVGCGLILALNLFVWHTCIHYVGPGLATILGNFQVFILASVGIFLFKEKPTTLFLVSVPLAFLGLFLLIGVDIDYLTDDHLIGVGYGIATAFLYGGFILSLRHLQGRETSPPVFYYQVVLLVACSLFLGLKISLSSDSFVLHGAQSILSLLGLGFFSQAVGWVIITNYLPRVRASYAGLILLLQPALSFIWDVILFDRPTGIFGWTGLFIVLAAIYLTTLRPSERFD